MSHAYISRKTLPETTVSGLLTTKNNSHKMNPLYSQTIDDYSASSKSSDSPSPSSEPELNNSPGTLSATFYDSQSEGEIDESDEREDSGIEIPIPAKKTVPQRRSKQGKKRSPASPTAGKIKKLDHDWRGRMNQYGIKDPQVYRERLLQALKKFWAAGHESSEEWKKSNLLDGE